MTGCHLVKCKMHLTKQKGPIRRPTLFALAFRDLLSSSINPLNPVRELIHHGILCLQSCHLQRKAEVRH
jgi:hypothetical protein